jgi:glycosyltransferase involved in cell wall biosynthesis
VAEPRVSVGIPTYNRAAKLARAAESVLAQSHRNLELVISDNASEDGTRQVCRELTERDARVRCLRSDVNRGPTANFNTVFGELRGDYVMVLSDDDWLDSEYVARCLDELLRRPELALVCGRARYFDAGRVAKQGVQMQLVQPSAAARVRRYVGEVDENGVFYGLMPADVLRRAAPLRNVLGNDWLLAAAIAAQGPVVTIDSAAINRETGGTSADFPRLVQTLGLPRWQASVPHLVIAWELFADIAWRVPVYRALPAARRAALALHAAWAAVSWRSLAWHATMPAFAALGRRRGGRWAWRGYLRLTRLLGAGREQPPQ